MDSNPTSVKIINNCFPSVAQEEELLSLHRDLGTDSTIDSNGERIRTNREIYVV